MTEESVKVAVRVRPFISFNVLIVEGEIGEINLLGPNGTYKPIEFNIIYNLLKITTNSNQVHPTPYCEVVYCKQPVCYSCRKACLDFCTKVLYLLSDSILGQIFPFNYFAVFSYQMYFPNTGHNCIKFINRTGCKHY